MYSRLVDFCNLLWPLLEASKASNTESEERIRIDGDEYAHAQEHLQGLLAMQREYELPGITIRINAESTDAEDFARRIKEGEAVNKWQVLIAKETISSYLLPDNDTITIWFLSQSAFENWAKNLEPFDASSDRFRSKKAIRILVHGINYHFGGPYMAVGNTCGDSIPRNWPTKHDNTIDEKAVRQQVHLLTNEIISLDPSPFLLQWGDVDSEQAKPFRLLSAKALCACLSQEIHSRDRVVFKGARRLDLPLVSEVDSIPNAEQLGVLWSAVQWVYSERPEVRAALIADRLTLDFTDGQSLLSGISLFIENALRQSKDQYKFVIKERKDIYAKELRDLMKDVQQHAGLFSEKIRSILYGLLRDVLAALLLISLGLFSRIGAAHEVLSSTEASILFKSLAVYLVVSLALQVLINLRDLSLSKQELIYWADAARNHLGIDDIERQLGKPISKREHNFYVMLTILALVYLSMALAAWHFHLIIKFFLLPM